MKTRQSKLFLLVVLMGWMIPAATGIGQTLPLKLDVTEDDGVVESDWQRLVSEGYYGQIEVTISSTGSFDYRDRDHGDAEMTNSDLWRNFVFAGGGEHLILTIEGLEPEEIYEITIGGFDYAVRNATPHTADWQVNDQTVLTTSWGIPGITLDDLLPGAVYEGDDFYPYVDGEVIDYMMSAVMFSDDQGTIELQSAPSAEGSYSPRINCVIIDHGTVPEPEPAYDPVPAEGSEGVDTEAILSWKGAPYWADPAKVNPDVVHYNVWLSSGAAGDEDLSYQDSVAVTDYNDVTAESEFAVSLDTDGTYYWAIEAAIDDGQGGAYPPGDSRNAMSPTWSFETIPAVPYIDAQPANTLAPQGGSAELTVEYTSKTDVQAKWFRGQQQLDPADERITVSTDNTQSTLTVSDFGSADEGPYHCVLTNEAGDTTSETVEVLLQSILAWYQFENNADDSAGANHGTVHGDPLGYVEGLIDTDGQSYAAQAEGAGYILLPADTAYPRAGFGNGMQSLTFAAWVKLEDGQGGHLLSNFNEGNNTGIRFSAESGQLGFYLRQQGNTAILRSASGLDWDADQWHHVAVTYDGSSVAFYLDGVQVQITDATGLSDFVDWENPMPLLALGNRGNHQELFDGQLDDLRIYNYAKSMEEIGMMYYEVTGQIPCIYGNPDGDFTGSCEVGSDDFAAFAEQWLQSGLYEPED